MLFGHVATHWYIILSNVEFTKYKLGHVVTHVLFESNEYVPCGQYFTHVFVEEEA